MEEAGSSEDVGSLEEVSSSGKVSLLEKAVLVLLTVETGAVKASIIEVDSRLCRQGGYGFLKQVKGAST